MDVFVLASRVPQVFLASKSDDDFSDRLNYRYTVGLLMLFSIIVISRQYGSAQSNINCWVPAHFTSVYEEYTSRICFISNTYYYDLNENIPHDVSTRTKTEIKYYQWVSFILLFQALAFYMPRIFWRSASTRSGLDISDLVEAAYNYKSADKFQEREKHMNYMVSNIDQYVDDPRRYDENRPLNIIKRFLILATPCGGRFLGNYIVILYFLCKLLYILNNILQMLMLSAIFERNFFDFGFYFIKKIIQGGGWSFESKYFPKVALCDFTIREWGNPFKNHRYTVQCVLPINLFNQQIFIGIWFWYFLILFWNIFELFKWIYKCLPNRSSQWIMRRVKLFDESVQSDSRTLAHFVETYLEPDGIFMIQIIANNTSDFVATDLIQKLWQKHIEKYEEYKDVDLVVRKNSMMKLHPVDV